MMEPKQRKRVRDRKWREDHRQQIRVYGSWWYQEHKELTKARARKWREEHTQQKHEYDRAYYLEHREAIRLRQTENAERIAAQQRCYRRTDQGRTAHRTDQNRRRARKAELASTFTEAQWQSALAHFGHHCAYCGSSVETLQQEHVIPLSAGGAYVVENIVPACARCNLSKHDSSLGEWMLARGAPFVLADTLASVTRYFESALEKRRK